MDIKLNPSPATLMGEKDVLVNDLKTVAADADRLLNDAVAAGRSGVSGARARIEARMDAAQLRLHDARLAVAARARQAAGATNGYVSENPWKAIGIAAAAGLVVALLLRRR